MASALFSAAEFAREALAAERCAANILQDMIAEHSGKLSFSSYRTVFRCGGIATSAAASCFDRTNELLLDSWLEKAALVP